MYKYGFVCDFEDLPCRKADEAVAGSCSSLFPGLSLPIRAFTPRTSRGCRKTNLKFSNCRNSFRWPACDPHPWQRGQTRQPCRPGRPWQRRHCESVSNACIKTKIWGSYRVPMGALLSLATSLLASLDAPLVASWTFSPTKLAPCLRESILFELGVGCVGGLCG